MMMPAGARHDKTAFGSMPPRGLIVGVLRAVLTLSKARAIRSPLMIGDKSDHGRWLSFIGAGLSVALVFCLLALTPVGVTLELHHALGAQDSDGHEHSDSDLCQWIQHHIGTSLLSDVLEPVSSVLISIQTVPVRDLYTSTRFPQTGPPRGPPSPSV